jgi:hypothetical protein
LREGISRNFAIASMLHSWTDSSSHRRSSPGRGEQEKEKEKEKGKDRERIGKDRE